MPVLAAPGQLDTSFADDGSFELELNGASSVAVKAIEQTDGKIVVVGYGPANDPPSPNSAASSFNAASDILIFRLNRDGTLDPTLDNDGVRRVERPGVADYAVAVTQQSDGKLLVAAAIDVATATSKIAVIRLDSAGALDSTFANNGVAVVPFIGVHERPNALALQTDGKILVGGSSLTDVRNFIVMARLTPAGTLDSSFGTGGRVLLDHKGSSAVSTGLAVKTDGNIVVAGHTTKVNASAVFVTQLTSNGSLDQSFGTGGFASQAFGVDQYSSGVTVQSDGKIITSGFYRPSGAAVVWRPFLARFNANGAADASFGSGGNFLFPQIEGSINHVIAVPGGKIVGVGRSDSTQSGNLRSALLVTRLRADGSLDPLFGTNGIATPAVDDDYATGTSVFRQSDGKLVVAGVRSQVKTGSETDPAQSRGIVARVDPGSVSVQPTFEVAENQSALINVSFTGIGPANVNYSTTAGSATAPDFTATSGTLSWAQAETGAKTITIPVTDDDIDEPAETFTLTLAGAVDTELGPATTTISIADNDPAPTLGFAAPLPNGVNETLTSISLTVSKSGDSASPVSVSYTTVVGTASEGSDFTRTTGTLTWPAGDRAAKSIVVPLIPDSVDEANETFVVTLSNPSNATLATSSVTLTIEDDDPGPAGGGPVGGGGGANPDVIVVDNRRRGGGGALDIFVVALLGVLALAKARRYPSCSK